MAARRTPRRLDARLALFGCLLAGGCGACDRAPPAPASHQPDSAVTSPANAAPDADAAPALDTDDDRARRRAMVRTQLAGRDIRDPRVLQAMGQIPRHRFVAPHQRSRAYADYPLAIEHGQTISQPYVVAFMTQALQLQGTERVLEVGTGSGYQAAVLAELCREVYSIEIIPQLSKSAGAVLRALNYKNVFLRVGDGYRGWPEKAPFDAIMVTAAPPQVPQPLIDQLAPSGRMILPVGDLYQDLVLIQRTDRGIERRQVLPVRFVPMTGEAQRNRPSP